MKRLKLNEKCMQPMNKSSSHTPFFRKQKKKFARKESGINVFCF